MKLLIYSHWFAPSVGGVETAVLLLAKGLAARASDPGSGKIEVTVVTRFPAEGFDDGTLPFRIVRRPGLWQLLRALGEADIVHLAGPSLLPLVLGLLLRKPVVVEHHGFQAVCPNGQLFYEPTRTPCPGHFMAHRHYECLRCNAKQGKMRSLRLWLLTFPRRWLCGRVALNIAPTNWLGGVSQLPRTATVYHGVPVPTATDDSAISGPPFTFAFLGRLVSNKGVHVLLQAAERLKSQRIAFGLRIIGRGPEGSFLEAQTAALGLSDRVEFLGELQGKALEKALNGVAAIVMPSLWPEAFGLVAAENMIQGRLLIVSDIGALAEVVGDVGLKFPPGDADGLAACLQQVMKSTRLTELGRKAYQRGMRFFRDERMIDDHLQLYRNLLHERGRPC